MQDELKSGNSGQGGKAPLSCADFDRLLADALDGVMAGQELELFRSHAQACADCGPLFTHAQSGMSWIKSLKHVEPPVHLVHNILAATSMADSALKQHAGGRALGSDSWLRRLADSISPSLAPALAVISQPRFAMTAATAFFSISMVLNLAGVRVKDLKHVDLRPSAISTTASVQYHETTARVVKYYENIRLVYELESRMKALKDAAETPDDSSGSPNQRQDRKKKGPSNDSSQNPRDERNRREEFSSEKLGIMMAVLRLQDDQQVSRNSDRRFL